MFMDYKLRKIKKCYMCYAENVSKFILSQYKNT